MLNVATDERSDCVSASAETRASSILSLKLKKKRRRRPGRGRRGQQQGPCVRRPTVMLPFKTNQRSCVEEQAGLSRTHRLYLKQLNDCVRLGQQCHFVAQATLTTITAAEATTTTNTGENR